MADKDRCPLCGGSKKPGTTTFAVDLGFGVVVVRDVPALACGDCGESWIDDVVASRLEQVVEAARAKQSTVEVTRWNQIAA
jgi:YgiT-type zinc finger domain-containing protein